MAVKRSAVVDTGLMKPSCEAAKWRVSIVSVAAEQTEPCFKTPPTHFTRTVGEVRIPPVVSASAGARIR
jgi:hypothetical protein